MTKNLGKLLNIKKEEFDKAHEYDKLKKSRQYQTVFFLKKTKKANDPHIRVECTVWSEKVKKKDLSTTPISIYRQLLLQ